MTDPSQSPDQGRQHDEKHERIEEGATPADIGALDGAAAAGSPMSGAHSDDDDLVPTSAPDPSVGPD